MRFAKYEGLGNDFIVVEADGPLGAGKVVGLCDRHFGIGADGVLVVAPPRSPGAVATMIVENADGSRPEMCGNGLRCVALHLARRDGADRAEFVVDTDAGPRRCQVERRGDAGQVLIGLGSAAPGGELRHAESVFSSVSMGNPHAVRLDGGIPDIAVVDEVGAALSGRVPGGTNVEFVQQTAPRKLDVVVWERGVGRTLACGTGAGAVAAAFAAAGRVPFDEPVEVTLPGGPLEVTVTRGSLDVSLRGPARRVFAGETSEST